tara:strand:- start:3485 stop:3961 length:477 start_codon:yes stop_codon:yes gene_type:complete
MGLDQWLTGKQYISTYDPEDVEMQKRLGEVLRDFNHGFKVQYIEYEIITWRKANFIHNWFVQNVQDGADNCGTYRVEAHQLKELKNICEELALTPFVQNAPKPEQLLPPIPGFFFGSQEIDELYFEEVKRTAEILSKAIPLDHMDCINGMEFYYSSSW